MNGTDQFGKVGEWVRTAVVNNPEGLLLLAAGGVLLMRKAPAGGGGSRARSDGTRAAHYSRNAQRSRDAGGSNVLDGARSAAESVAASASNYASEAGRLATESSAYVVDKAQATFGSSFNRMLDSQPLLVAVGGFAAGAAFAAVLPASELEKQTLGPIGEQISGEASRFGDQLEETASKAAGTLKSSAQEHILEQDGVRKIVAEVTDVVREGLGGAHGQGSNPGSSSGEPSGENKG
jgi:hypothetical protein